ncbi:MAG: hypothetical protein ACRCTI_02280 [Beijerinckiaceae bacterium]
MARVTGSNGSAEAADGTPQGMSPGGADTRLLDTLLLAQALGAETARMAMRSRTLTRPSGAVRAYEAALRLV